MFSVVTGVYAEFIKDFRFLLARSSFIAYIYTIKVFHACSWTHNITLPKCHYKGYFFGNINYESTKHFKINLGNI